MKNYILSLTLCAFAAQIATAQSITASGTVKNEKGEAVRSALVQESDTKTVTYTDSLGFFTLPVKSTTEQIVVSAKGYKDEKVLAKDNNIIVVLKPGKSSFKELTPGDPNKIVASAGEVNTNQGYSFFNVSSAGGGNLFNVARKEDTKGSRYLVGDGWAKGYVVDKTGATVKNDNFSYNYDKINGSLLLTQDKRAAVDVDRDQIKSFTIYNSLDQPQTYQLVSGINPTHYSQVLSDGANYKVYKYTKTTFVKSDFKTDGMTSTGNHYDEYVDEPTYYILNVKSGAMQKVNLKAKALKQAFAADADKVKSYFSAHADDEVNDAFLSGLADSLN
ncbi:carboxypeptidase-like regulatory domain-containing protein [Mucilaginibacter flavus]|uniref:carboxypeptidase-like regulatory domain-containing protein n=1 Tax=Mucilaginibacter flavus TaxID=931504 RepID=UPI0025B399F3|nr:carboxypeptidase-like regulatory domain-containing protein [Mucilaginibacter flavus]MDN3582367.1 carboxypeptidase-like regulatory domain-containing protein [Mucilaginibacter flavus]